MSSRANKTQTGRPKVWATTLGSNNNVIRAACVMVYYQVMMMFSHQLNFPEIWPVVTKQAETFFMVSGTGIEGGTRSDFVTSHSNMGILKLDFC